MVCDFYIFCSSNTNLTDYVGYNGSISNASATSNFSFEVITTKEPGVETTTNDNDITKIIHALPGYGAATAIVFLAVVVFIACCFLLLATHWTGSGRTATSVFLRSLYLSEMLMSIYGICKMAMILHMNTLTINFFLPESLLFTASFACTMSLVFLNMDCFMKLAKPQQVRQVQGYSFVDKDTVITVMLLMWNAAFIVGFLPLIGWNQDDNTVHFFRFYAWHYLFFNGCINIISVIVCVGCIVAVKRSQKRCELDYDYFSTQIMEFHNYKHLHITVMADSALWLGCYLPYFLYLSLACRQCPLSDSPYQDSAVIYFIPIFLLKSLFSCVLQACRTLNAHTTLSQLLSEISIIKQIRERTQEMMRHPKESEAVAISYSNPLCEFTNHSLPHRNQMQHRFSAVEFSELLSISDLYSSANNTNSALDGISN